jgi:trimeric autotransporter adhesin
MNPVIQLKQTSPVFFVTMLLACFGLLHVARAVVPPPDGGYPGGNTAEGQAALFSLTTGSFNTAVGFVSLRSNTEGHFNTGVGAGTLLANVGQQNTATGAAALLNNTTGVKNTADGVLALSSNTTGNSNTATGVGALFDNSEGFNNTAIGYNALLRNTTAGDNAAVGTTSLFNNSTGEFNVAVGSQALYNNVSGGSNTAVGDSAGFNITGSGNVCIGAGMNGFAGENNITRIRNVYGSAATERAVYVTSDNRIGTLVSSRRYKDDIRPMEESSKTIHSLRPVRFRYKKEVDPTRSLCFGLIAEDVAKASPELVTLDREGRPQTVRYEAINAMLLNEFLKEHRKVESQESRIQQQEATIARQQKQIDALSAGLQKVTAHLEMREAAPQTVLNNH